MKNIVLCIFLVIVAFMAGFAVSAGKVSQQYRSEIVRLKGEAAIYKAEADKYAQTIKAIRSTADEATLTEKAN